jgi:hypothetical protein
MEKTRLVAFSDGVLAIIITVARDQVRAVGKNKFCGRKKQ